MPVTLEDNLRSLRGEFRADLEENHITLDRLAADLDRLLQATETKVFCTKAGEIVYSEPMEALAIRLAALREALKLRDLYPAEKSEVKHDGQVSIGVVTGIDRAPNEAVSEDE